MKLVAIGGGNGLSQILLGVRHDFTERTAIVAVTDTGRSTGIARTLAAIPAPGDLRNTLATLASDPNAIYARLLQHRFHSNEIPALEGMAFGNLLLGALAQVTGDFAQAVELVSELVQTTAQVLPVSVINTNLCAELEDGQIMHHELEVRGLNKPPIHRLFLADPSAPVYPPAIEAITRADIIVIGPGSFFTSVLATLLFDGMAEALKRSTARVVFISNTTTQPGQTDGFCALNHVQWIQEVVGPGIIDDVIINRNNNLAPDLIAQYASEGLHLLQPDDHEIASIAATGIRPLVGNYVQSTEQKRTLWNKQDTIRHDPALIGQTLRRIVKKNGTESPGNTSRPTTDNDGC